MSLLPDLRKIEPELLEDDIECALQDSMDVNWTCSTGAHAIMRMLFKLATCPSCGGLNTSCPEGCGRDTETGELDGSMLALAAGTRSAETTGSAPKGCQSGAAKTAQRPTSVASSDKERE